MSNEVRIGGNVNGPVAVGTKARAIQRDVTIGAAGVQAAIDDLRRALDEHRDRIPEPARVEKDIQAVDQATREEDPDPDAVRDALRRISTRVGMVTTVLAAAEKLRETVETILH
jgi:hypothetical protein